MIDDQLPVFESLYKKLGIKPVNILTLNDINSGKYKPYIKVLYLSAGNRITVDFKNYTTHSWSLFFINSNQFININGPGKDDGYMIYYNRDFYCVQIHDTEVACDGLLFNNLNNIPVTTLSPDATIVANNIFNLITEELKEIQAQQEEMLRVYLKQLIIFATRLWCAQHLSKSNDSETYNDIGVFRQFSILVENHYKNKHSVSEYAEMMGMAPKTLTHKLRKMNLSQPNEVIKDRIILEAKRLLIHTSMSAKEIGYYLGYDDPAYFNRLFTSKVGDHTSGFRKKFS